MASIEASKEIADKVYEAIEVSRATGKICKGANEATKAVAKGKAKLVVIAKDTQPAEVIMHIPMLAEEKNITCVTVPSKEELGTAAGINRPTAAVAIIVEGEAKNILKEIG